jgi:hypothetical protein
VEGFREKAWPRRPADLLGQRSDVLRLALDGALQPRQRLRVETRAVLSFQLTPLCFAHELALTGRRWRFRMAARPLPYLRDRANGIAGLPDCLCFIPDTPGSVLVLHMPRLRSRRRRGVASVGAARCRDPDHQHRRRDSDLIDGRQRRAVRLLRRLGLGTQGRERGAAVREAGAVRLPEAGPDPALRGEGRPLVHVL